MIAGPFVLVSTAAFYGADKPSTFAHFSKYLSPWADDARLRRDGVAILCQDIPLCIQYMDETARQLGGAARRIDVTLERRWLGFTSAPKRFLITIVPPR